jgi:hypothetical protein
MRDVLAITMALMLAAVILSPAVGYTIQSGSNESYSIGSTFENYSFQAGQPASNLTPESIPIAVAPTSAVTVTQVPYSIKVGAAAPYSVSVVSPNETGGVSLPAVTPVGTTTTPSAEIVGEQIPTQPTPISAPVLPPMSAPAATPVENITPAEVKTPVENVTAPATAPAELSIMGIVYDDANGNGVKDANETGLAGWAVNLEKPAGMIMANTTTAESGSYAFDDLSAGVYTVHEILPEGWSAVAPADGYMTVNLTATNAMNVDFGNKMAMQENATAPATAMPKGNTTA